MKLDEAKEALAELQEIIEKYNHEDFNFTDEDLNDYDFIGLDIENFTGDDDAYVITFDIKLFKN